MSNRTEAARGMIIGGLGGGLGEGLRDSSVLRLLRWIVGDGLLGILLLAEP